MPCDSGRTADIGVFMGYYIAFRVAWGACDSGPTADIGFLIEYFIAFRVDPAMLARRWAGGDAPSKRFLRFFWCADDAHVRLLRCVSDAASWRVLLSCSLWTSSTCSGIVVARLVS